MSDGPFTDDFVRHGILSVQTQRGIIEYAEGMAQVLAEAGRASNKAVGDPAEYAIRRWSEIILKRALELVRDDPNPKKERLEKQFKKLMAK